MPTVIHKSDPDQIVLRESDAEKRALGNVLVIAFGVVAILVGSLYLLHAIRTWTPQIGSVKMGGLGVAGILGGIWLMGFGGTNLEREQYILSPENVVVVYRNKFKHVRKWYRADGATGLFLELSGSAARGGILWPSGLALAFCHGDAESVAAILQDAATLFGLPPWQYLLVDAPVRERLFQPNLPGLALLDRDEGMRSGERLSWKAQGVEKKFAHIGRFDTPPHPEAWQDGAFHLAAYPHSFWDVPARTARFITPGGSEQIVRFEEIDAVGIRPTQPKMAHDQGGETYPVYTAALIARLKNGETRTLSTLVRIGVVVPGTDPAAHAAQILAARLREWTGAIVAAPAA